MFIQTIVYILLPLVVTYITVLVCAKATARTSHTDIISRGLSLHVRIAVPNVERQLYVDCPGGYKVDRQGCLSYLCSI